ncbi:FAD/FMN-containing dehydrogenase [Halopolyspora algeriensis]|uniref:FAD/FMN-containing dehydrogenase n=1 Tax=Halopolyspora algeriensis TaxID=1500506 RepID=A0A368VY72_9ACTN|nr:FAD-binding and (Fe-S)-binding domain-containing protein [Halopolyspora algeriensis]RCW46267.1 FAD/FMN-containing dehydrogenase [Halopolyspora algeriensis]TQM55669.1 FAD/FMN-containing dehydrogenase [Halopolyspora algeriensis]
MPAEQVTVPAHPDSRFSTGMAGTATVNVQGLEAHLRRNVRGEVRFDTASKALYASDASNYRQVPLGVVLPATLDDVVATTVACHRYGAPLLSRGGGTSLSGETVNVAVVLDFSKYLTGTEDVDVARRTVTAQPGAINEEVNRLTGEHNLVFGPDPSSHSRCTIGGNIGNNSCGIHSVQAHFYGPGPRTSDNVHALEVLTYDGARFWVGVDEEESLDRIIAEGGRKGEIYAKLRDLRDRYAADIRAGFPSVDEMPRRVSGYNLDELLPEKGFNVARALVGTEGTCATALNATLLLTPAMFERTTVIVEYENIVDAAEHVTQIRQWQPIGLEAIDSRLVHDQQQEKINLEGLHELPRLGGNHAWLMVQFGADSKEESVHRAERFTEWLRSDLGYDADRIVVSRSVQEGGNSQILWNIRESGLGSTAFPPGQKDHWPGWEDSAVPPEHLGDYLRRLRALYAEYGLRGAMYGHFGEGCIHSRIDFDLRSAEGLATYRSFMEAAADLVVSYGGSVSGEHGDGQQRAELLSRQYGPRLMEAMHEFKRIWDPAWKMNPGKVVDAYRFDENLRLGTDYNPSRPEVKLAYPQDNGDFSHAALRCVGVGTCRVPEAENTMCPSYQVTREEKHTTRGRARLLFEMLQGEVITDGWQSREVSESLDLCLACKGCTSDCPVGVDMPSYKAEFRYHHYRSMRRWRPRYAYAFGFIDQASRLAALMPGVVNTATRTPLLRSLVKWAGGIDQRRELPTFAPITLQQWFADRGGTANPYGRRVVLFPDTFNNHLHTDVGVACVEALEAAGWQVVMPERHVCCGRPLYDYGFLDAAQRYLHNVLGMLRSDIRAGTPVVGMEPSCLAVFRDEMGKMLPHDDDATRLAANAYHFAEFVEAFDIEVPELAHQALLWGHCHHRATGGIDPDRTMLERMGVEVQPVSGGCCGVAGAWGYEQGKFDISVDCGEQALLPAVRGADPDTLVVADGFSCQTQIGQVGGGRRALHSAQVMQLARDGARDGQPGETARGEAAESAYRRQRPRPGRRRRAVRLAGLAGGLGVLGGAATALARRGRSHIG